MRARGRYEGTGVMLATAAQVAIAGRAAATATAS
jgi:hypothetical protein